MSVTIREKGSGSVLARGDLGADVVSYEGNLYFAPGVVERDVLRVTDRTYTCPYKGTCNWVDYVGPDGKTVKDVAWLYPSPKAGHEVIKDRYGFYAGSRGATRQE
jgi:uncharacterized protein (DUF427 family)